MINELRSEQLDVVGGGESTVISFSEWEFSVNPDAIVHAVVSVVKEAAMCALIAYTCHGLAATDDNTATWVKKIVPLARFTIATGLIYGAHKAINIISKSFDFDINK